MHLPPEVERLVPELLTRVAEPAAVEPEREARRIEALLLAGNPERWLDYLREQGQLLERRVSAGTAADATAAARLAAILRDQLALIQVVVDLGPDDLALLDRLERIERGGESGL